MYQGTVRDASERLGCTASIGRLHTAHIPHHAAPAHLTLTSVACPCVGSTLTHTQPRQLSYPPTSPCLGLCAPHARRYAPRWQPSALSTPLLPHICALSIGLSTFYICTAKGCHHISLHMYASTLLSLSCCCALGFRCMLPSATASLHLASRS